MLNQCFDEASAPARVSEEPVIRPTSQEAFFSEEQHVTPGGREDAPREREIKRERGPAW